MQTEEVLVFPERILRAYKLSNFQAYTQEYRHLLSEIRAASAFMPRAEVEDDLSLLQIIPYSYVYGWKPEVLVYRRTKKGSESQLHGKLSIGVGGHINPEDNQGEQIFKIAALREINEEFSFTGGTRKTTDPTRSVPDILDFTLRGFIRRTDTPVNAVHFGVVYAFASPSDTVTPASPECEVVGWSRLKELHAPETFEQLEDWSKDLLTFLMR
jgi:predicted NUDIX family phosphoesterase